MLLYFLVSTLLVIIITCDQNVDEISPPAPKPRAKRVILGDQLTLSPYSYEVIRYQAFIASGHWCPNSRTRKWEICDPNPNELVCGGVAIHEYLVETACHCLSIFVRRNSTFERAVLKNDWEGRYVVFVGYTEVDYMRYSGSWSKTFAIHEKCGRVLNGGVSYDFGLMFVERMAVISAFPVVKPAYPIDMIKKNHYLSIVRESVCLLVGWGSDQYIRDGVPDTSSSVLRHGWRSLMSRYRNYEVTFAFTNGSYHQHNYYPDDVMTWHCTEHFGLEIGMSYLGDAGSPITCNGIFFGIGSFVVLVNKSSPFYHPNSQYSYDCVAPAVYALRENSVEYLEEVVKQMTPEGVTIRFSEHKYGDPNVLTPPKSIVTTYKKKFRSSSPTRFSLSLPFFIFLCLLQIVYM